MNKCAIPDFKIQHRESRGFIFVHGSIHFKNQKRLMHDYHQYTEMLASGNKCFVILNETIETATASVLRGWLMACMVCLVDDRQYRAMYAGEKELGYLQRAVMEQVAN